MGWQGVPVVLSRLDLTGRTLLRDTVGKLRAGRLRLSRPGKPAPREDRGALWRALIGGALGLIIAAATGIYLAQQREELLSDTGREMQNLALAVGNWAEDSFRTIDLVTAELAAWIRAEGIDTPQEFHERLRTRAAHTGLRARIAALPRVHELMVVDADGRMVATSAAWPPPDATLAGQEVLEALRERPGPDTVLGTPVRDREGHWAVPFSRWVGDADGTLLGAVVVIIDLGFFEDFFARLTQGPGSTVALYRRDGMLLVRYPRLEHLIATSFGETAKFRQGLTVGPSSAVRGPSLLDGVERISGVRVGTITPLVLVTSRTLEDVLAPWRRDAWHFGLGVLLLEALTLGAVLLANRLASARQRERNARALEYRMALDAVFANATAGLVEADTATGRFLRVNRRYCELTGRTEAELCRGMTPFDVVHPADRNRVLAFWRAAQVNASRFDAELRYLRPDGTVVWGRVSVGISARGPGGKPLRHIGIVQDITALRAATERLRASEGLLRLGMETSRIGTYIHDLTTGAISCDAGVRALHGLPAGEAPISLRSWLATLLPVDRRRVLAAIADALVRRRPDLTLAYRIRRPGESKLRHIELRTHFSYDANGRPVSDIGAVIDVTDSREAEALLRLSLEAGHIGIFHHDFVTDLVHCSPEARAMIGLPAGEAPLTAAQWWGPMLPEDQENLRAIIADSIGQHAPKGISTFRARHLGDGRLRHFEARVRWEYDETGQPLGALGVIIDVTERREAEAHIAHLARHDPLTGLPNRALFHERLQEALARAQRGEGFAVLLIDLDRFKEVNDTLGHPVGDALLRAVTGRLLAELRETDTLARLGGDEFAIIQSDVAQPKATLPLARRLVEMLGHPFELDGHQVVIGSSIGIALAPVDGRDADRLVKAADLALYRAKEEGRGRWRFFEPGMDAHMQRRRALELDLRRALQAGEFALFYQPVVDAASRRISGLEALLRWQHPGRGLVLPAAFMPLAEEIGLIVPIGEWVLARACADAAGWPGRLRVAVNLSPAQFAHRGLIDAVAAALERSRLDPARLELEITETVMLQETEATLATLHRLKSLGVRIVMDDFGTGYSSLSYLRRFPFDKVKIDRSFTRELEQSRQSHAIVRAVADMCSALSVITTAEGVETEAQLQTLLLDGCDEAQGNLFSRPLPADEIPFLLEQARLSA
ncbi:EAL domain-containing protein [Rhodovastum atsumiense]|uniref:EAL domain-containing protein n=1 Tax=Rhodovastum atsumiense TaxID=504468 RepID=A0A5M6INL8_9PROT|nr:EAL domain-containing protein [Rhodovastum atsumiense]KAA5609863.1 EAL domain-containing protein [Rhodovastum atsumiense]CAH2602437.1 EAL domain-containing protein [Rhodovastum atsumiense]